MKSGERIILPLDLPDPEEAKKMVKNLHGIVDFFKVGMLLQFTGGGEIINWLIKNGKKVFLDMKYYDIPETVASVVRQVAETGVHFLTIHGNRRIIEHAVKARGKSSLKLLAVTVLTSMDADDLQDLGLNCSLNEMVIYRAQKAVEYGCNGLIASGRELAFLRASMGDDLLLVTPGIRPAGSGHDEHKRAVTPAEAIQAGADYLVVGRPILQAPDPSKAALCIIEEIEQARRS